jgi:hypothetical protein
MLLNLTNHPSKLWGGGQLNAATTMYGSVIDMAFPAIDPSMDLKAVNALAKEYLYKVLSTGCDAVLLQGEFTFTIQLGVMLSKYMPVLTACSERNTTLNEDGTKTVAFEFVQFRDMFAESRESHFSYSVTHTFSQELEKRIMEILRSEYPEYWQLIEILGWKLWLREDPAGYMVLEISHTGFQASISSQIKLMISGVGVEEGTIPNYEYEVGGWEPEYLNTCYYYVQDEIKLR